MVEPAQAKLAQAGFDPGCIAQADVTHLPFPDHAFDAVISMCAIALFKPVFQRQAMRELARVTRCEFRLLKSFEKRKGLYVGRILAFMFDGMRPISPEAFGACGLDCQEVWDIFGGAFSYLRCFKSQSEND